jgi:hypothetical protein
MLTVEEKKMIAAVKANWDDRSVPGQLVKIIERLTAVEPRPARSERAWPPRGIGEMGQ